MIASPLGPTARIALGPLRINSVELRVKAANDNGGPKQRCQNGCFSHHGFNKWSSSLREETGISVGVTESMLESELAIRHGKEQGGGQKKGLVRFTSPSHAAKMMEFDR
jgi:hypothetical protein